jgi:RNA polymerase sigma-70 factor, ECF subfamily
MLPAMVHSGSPPSGAVALVPHGREQTPEQDLSVRAAGGDREALQALLREIARPLFTLSSHLCGAQDGRDATQEALERIVRSLDRFDPQRGAFRPWALSVARNVCRDRLRRRGLERAAFDADGDEQTALAPSRAPDPERLALARADAQALEAALATLPENMRAALVLFHFQEASYEEIASTLGVPIGTVMTWIFRGRRKLRDAMEESGKGEET